MDRMDELYCQKIHEAIPDTAPVILTLFNKDAFQDSTYLEVRYLQERGYATLYFCPVSPHRLQMNQFSIIEAAGYPAVPFSQYLENLEFAAFLCCARISGKELCYILDVLDACQNIQFHRPLCGRDGNFVTLKSHWGAGATFCYYCTPVGSHTEIAEVVWLLADYLPRPARNSLQFGLSDRDVYNLRQKLQSDEDLDARTSVLERIIRKDSP